MAREPSTADASLRRRVSSLPDQPGIYLFKDASGRILYVGKALSLRKRVGSYFRPLGLSPRTSKLMKQVAGLDTRQTASETEALLLEAELIKAHQPRYNVIFRDDKAYPFLKVTNEPFPRLVVARRRLPDGAKYFGPYTDATLMHEAVRFLRRVFPMRTCRTFPKTPCLEYHIGQCLAPCAAFIDAAAYQRIVDDLVAFLSGRRDALLRDLKRRMERAARDRQFEEAARIRDQVQALTSVVAAKEKSADAGPLEQLQAALKLPVLPRRIEGFDISNIFGDFTVASMVVMADGKPRRSDYRKFNIKTVPGIDDFASMREVITRRYSGTLASRLPLPDLVLVDGGKGQLSAARGALRELSLQLPVIGLAKRYEHIFLPEQDEPIVLLPSSPVLHLIQRLRDEAHRFAITAHRRKRDREVTASALDAIPGIGPVRKQLLLRRLGSVERLAKALPEEVALAGRLPLPLAHAIVKYLNAPQRARRS